MDFQKGDKVRISSDSLDYVGRHLSTNGIILGKDSEGDFLVESYLYNKGRVVGGDRAWIKPYHLALRKSKGK